MFIGPVCDYVIAPVARYCTVWGTPLITPAAQAEAFSVKSPQYMTLTRMMGSYVFLGPVVRKILRKFNWGVAGMLFHNYPRGSGVGNSRCYFVMGGIYSNNRERFPKFEEFNENDANNDYKEKLRDMQSGARSKYLNEHIDAFISS